MTWVVVPFINSFAAGAKTFDFDLNQVSFNAERAQTADLSTGYYFGNQSLVVLKKSPLAKATSIAELKGGTFGAQVGTTSLDAINTIIAPTTAPMIYDSNDAAIQALGSGTIDGIMVDLPTADFITNVQLDTSTIVGQFAGGYARALQRGPGQGQRADRVRERRHRFVDRGRHAQDPGQQVAPVPGQRPGLQAVAGEGAARPRRR